MPLVSHQCPEDRENSGGSQDEQAAQGLWVVGLHHFNDPEQRLDSGPPQVAHVQSFQVHQARPAAAEDEEDEEDKEYKGVTETGCQKTHFLKHGAAS